jgi:hypothetical protein
MFLFNTITFGKYKISVPVIIWFLLAAIAVSLEMSRGVESFNNYFTYKYVFIHARDLKNLYGPLFSLVIAPFSLFNDYIGCFFWCIANAWFLYFGVLKLHLSHHQKMAALLIGVIEMMTSLHNVEFNPMVAGWIILSFVMIEKEKDFWGTFFIAIGMLTKIYGIVGLCFFLFSKHKIKFIVYFLFWLAVLFCLPMIISSPKFIIQSYHDWYDKIVSKNSKNINPNNTYNMQDISVMGLFRRIFNLKNLSNLSVLIPAAIAYLIPVFRIKEYKNENFRLSYLAFALIGVVIFSSSAESPTYSIAMIGVAIWFVIQPKNNLSIALLVFALIITSLSPTDLFPRYLKEHFIVPYALKALPCFVIWLVIAYQLILNKFSINSVSSQVI